MLQPRLNYQFRCKDMLKSFAAIFSYKSPADDFLNKLFKTDDVFFFDHARSGLKEILKLIPVDSVVGVQPLTCPTVLEAIEGAGHRICFIDITDELVINEKTLSAKINKIDALIVTHTFGNVAPVAELKELMPGKIIIEDCAHAFLSERNGITAGTQGNFAIFSFGFAKFPAALRGGFVVVNDKSYLPEFEKRYSVLTYPGFIKEMRNLFRSKILMLLHKRIIYTLLTSKLKKKIFNYKKPVTEPEVYREYKSSRAVFDSLLTDITHLVGIQQKNDTRLRAVLIKNKSFRICQTREGRNGFMLPVLVNDPERFIEFAGKNGIETGRHFYRSKDIVPYYDYTTGECENYERVINKLVVLPTHYNYPERQLKKLINIIERYTNE